MKRYVMRPILLGISCVFWGLFSTLPATAQEPGSVLTIHSSKPSIPRSQAWAVGNSPLFEAGALGNQDGLDLYNVRDIVRLEDGTTVVANSGQLELVFLSSTGRVIAIVGSLNFVPIFSTNLSSRGWKAV